MAITEKPIKDLEPNFSDVTNRFIDHIESLSTSLPLVLGIIHIAEKKSSENHKEFLERHGEKKEKEDGTKYYLIKPENQRRNKVLRREVTKANIAFKILERNFLVSLVSQFDAFMGDLIKTMFYVRPELLNSSDKQLTFGKLLEFGDIESAREHIIEKEIETVLRESHAEQFKWLERKIAINLSSDLPIWPVFIELTQRRNLYVHNDGKISNQYIKLCKDHGVQFEMDLRVGDNLEMGKDYLQVAIECVFELGIKLSQVIWRKINPNDIVKADEALLGLSYELLYNEQYLICRTILNFQEKYVKCSSLDIELRLLINRALSHKWLNDEEKCKKIVESKDWSATSNIFKLAKHVLLNEYEKAVEIMKLLANNSTEIDHIAYREWPLFKSFRNQEIFKITLNELYGSQFTLKEQIAQSGFKIINEDDFKVQLKKCLITAEKREYGFVGSKFFVETFLAKLGFDISSSWMLYNQLAEENKIETYTHSDPNGIFRDTRAVRFVV